MGVLVMIMVLWCSVVWAGEVNMVGAGVRVNSRENVTGEIQRVIDSYPNGSVFYFPPGVYVVCDLVLRGREDIVLIGDEAGSVLEYCNPEVGYSPMMTVFGGKRIAIKYLTFDNKHILSYGGVVIYEIEGLKVIGNRFIDSQPREYNGFDRYGLVLGRGVETSKDVIIQSNEFEYLNLEVDHSERVTVDLNVVRNSLSVAGIGGFTISDGSVLREIVVKRNQIVEPGGFCGRGYGIVFNLDPSSSNNNLFEGVTIKENVIIRDTSYGYNMRIGTADTSQVTEGNVFRSFMVRNNTVVYQSRPVEYAAFIVTGNASLVFEDIVEMDNVVVDE